jgi:hypothetical protein
MKNNSKISAMIAVTVAAVGCAGASDWPQWGGTIFKNMVSEEKGLPVSFSPTARKGADGRGNPDTSTATVLWTACLGKKTFGNPVVAGGRVFVGTSFPVTDPKYDPVSERGAVMCFDEANGKLLWQLNIPRDERQSGGFPAASTGNLFFANR